MDLKKLKFLTDENIDQEVLDFLRSQNFDVFDIKEAGLFRMPDFEILQLAFEQKRVVISQDSDFGTLIFRDKHDFFGIIYLRPGHQSPDVHIETMRAILDADLNFETPFILVVENTGELVRIRLRTV